MTNFSQNSLTASRQGSVVEPRRRFGEVLVRTNLVQAERLSLRNLGKCAAFAFVIFFVFLAIGDRRGHLIDTQIAVEFLHRAGSSESVVASGNVDSRLIEDRREHL